MTKPKKRIPYGDRKWKETHYVTAYKLARAGKSNEQICSAIGVTRGVFDRWRQERPALQEALDDARGAKERNSEYVQLLFERLSPECQDFWEKAKAAEPEAKDVEPEVKRDKRRLRLRLDEEITKMEVREKQRLYFFAFYSTDFNRSEACRLTGIRLDELARWRTDRDFCKLEREMLETKKDIFESALVQLVKQGEPSAVVFANKTLNRDRGYSDKVEVEVTKQEGFTVDDLNLTLEEKKKLLEAIRAKEVEVKVLGVKENVPDAEFQEVAK